ncbi:MAG TPA: hypothetical protein PKV73_06480 [Agriterribacter sp.]|nr:hypothetical protein [Agriterribacter sp.]
MKKPTNPWEKRMLPHDPYLDILGKTMKSIQYPLSFQQQLLNNL